MTVLIGLAATVFAAGPARVIGAEPEPRRRGMATFGVGASGDGPDAGLVAFGTGVALLDSRAARLELIGRAWISGGQRVRLDGSGGVTGRANLQRYSLLAELAFAGRVGRFEPWVSGGFGTVGTDGTFDYFCASADSPACAAFYLQQRKETFQGSWSGGPTVAGGLRYAFTDWLLLDGELRYRAKGESEFKDLPLTVEVGGFSGTLSIVWRFELSGLQRPAQPDVPQAAPEPPVTSASRDAPPPPPPEGSVSVERVEPAPTDSCPGGLSRVFKVHPLRRFRCYPDPVRGGFYCGEPTVDGELSDRSDCERACRSGADDCPAGGAAGAGCDRCVAECSRERDVPCTPVNEGTYVEGSCRLPAGAWGGRDPRMVPALCPAPPRAR